MKKYMAFIAGLVLSSVCSAQGVNMPKQTWLANLQKILPAHLCKPQSPLMRIYKGNNCIADMNALYKKCTTSVKNVVIPDVLTSVPQASRLGQVIAECMAAYYQGGQAVRLFNMMQSLSEK